MWQHWTGASKTRRPLRWLGAAVAASVLTLAPTAAFAKLRSVSANTANFRAGPSTKHPVIFSADRFYPVKIIAKKKDWVRIRDFEGDEAWVAGWLLCDTPTIVITRNVVNVREKPTARSTVVHTAERGAVFKLAGTKGSWLKVSDEEGEIGWIHRNLVWGSTEEKAKKPAQPTTKKKSATKKKSKAPNAEPKKDPKKITKKAPKAKPKKASRKAPKAASRTRPKGPDKVARKSDD